MKKRPKAVGAGLQVFREVDVRTLVRVQVVPVAPAKPKKSTAYLSKVYAVQAPFYPSLEKRLLMKSVLESGLDSTGPMGEYL